MDMCCKDLAEKLLLFRDGDLPEEEVQHLREHLHYCPPCLDLLNGYDEVVEVLCRLKPVKMPANLCESMKERLKTECGGTPDARQPEAASDGNGSEA